MVAGAWWSSIKQARSIHFIKGIIPGAWWCSILDGRSSINIPFVLKKLKLWSKNSESHVPVFLRQFPLTAAAPSSALHYHMAPAGRPTMAWPPRTILSGRQACRYHACRTSKPLWFPIITHHTSLSASISVSNLLALSDTSSQRGFQFRQVPRFTTVMLIRWMLRITVVLLLLCAFL